MKTKKGKTTLSFIGIFLLLAIPQTFFPGIFVSNSENLSSGIVEIKHPTNYRKFCSNIAGTTHEAIFYQMVVVIYDNGFIDSRVNSFKIEVTDSSGNIISTSHWNKLGSFLGKGSIGTSILIPVSNRFNDVSQELTVNVLLNFDFGGTDSKSISFNHAAQGCFP